ncbi:hypothetical protein C8R42DRAFT_643513 [Lentinula raphanica]|nr:hypothetical protein C8R42DRAFT_643513 [Lentinula raphanica]
MRSITIVVLYLVFTQAQHLPQSQLQMRTQFRRMETSLQGRKENVSSIYNVDYAQAQAQAQACANRLFHEVKPKRRAVPPLDLHLDDEDDSNEDEEEEDGKRTVYNAFTNACCDAFGRRNRSREPTTAYHSIHLIGRHRSQPNPDPNPSSLPHKK